MKPLSKADLLHKLESYCAYQERCEKEVLEKLSKLGATAKQKAEVVASLIKSNYIDEQRFAEVYARGKFSFKNWGRIKIEFELRSRGISNNSIQEGLKEINSTDYLQVIAKLADSKKKSTLEEDEYKLKEKIARYLYGKGFESDLIWKELNKK